MSLANDDHVSFMQGSAPPDFTDYPLHETNYDASSIFSMDLQQSTYSEAHNSFGIAHMIVEEDHGMHDGIQWSVFEDLFTIGDRASIDRAATYMWHHPAPSIRSRNGTADSQEFESSFCWTSRSGSVCSSVSSIQSVNHLCREQSSESLTSATSFSSVISSAMISTRSRSSTTPSLRTASLSNSRASSIFNLSQFKRELSMHNLALLTAYSSLLDMEYDNTDNRYSPASSFLSETKSEYSTTMTHSRSHYSKVSIADVHAISGGSFVQDTDTSSIISLTVASDKQCDNPISPISGLCDSVNGTACDHDPQFSSSSSDPTMCMAPSLPSHICSSCMAGKATQVEPSDAACSPQSPASLLPPTPQSSVFSATPDTTDDLYMSFSSLCNDDALRMASTSSLNQIQKMCSANGSETSFQLPSLSCPVSSLPTNLTMLGTNSSSSSTPLQEQTEDGRRPSKFKCFRLRVREALQRLQALRAPSARVSPISEIRDSKASSRVPQSPPVQEKPFLSPKKKFIQKLKAFFKK